MERIKVMIAEDQIIVRTGLVAMLDGEPDIHVLAAAGDGAALLEACRMQCPDVVISDIQMPGMDGVQLVAELHTRYPDIKVIMLTTFIDDALVLKALENGAVGYLLKDDSTDNIARAIRVAHQGGSLLTQRATDLLRNTLAKVESRAVHPIVEELTAREIAIINLIGSGYSNREVAEELHLSLGTIKNQISKLLTKLNLRDRTQLAIFAIHNDLVE